MPDDVTPEGAAPAAGSEAPGSAAAAATTAPAAPSGTQAAVDAARQRLAETGTMLPKEEAPAAEAGTETDEQKAARESAEAAAAAGETAEQKSAREAAEEAAKVAETPEQKAEREKAEAEAAEAEKPSEFVVSLPAEEDRGEKPIELEAPDRETFERLNRLQNEASVGRQVKQERRALERQYEQLEQLEDQLTSDPAGFVLGRVAESTRLEVAMQLAFDPDVLEAMNAAVTERLGKLGIETDLAGVLGNPEALRALRVELKESRLDLREQLSAKNTERKTSRDNARRVATQIESLIPETIIGEQREKLYQDALQDISERCRRLGIKNLESEDVALLVGNRFRAQGITAAPAKDAGNGTKPAAGPPPASGRTAAEFEQARKAKLAAAAAAPAGVVAPAAKARPVLPPTTEGRIALARKHGLRALLGR